LTKKFQYSYQKKIVKSFQNYSEVNIVGMGGSILGTEAIYDFLKHKVKKKFIFFNNIKFKNITKTKKKNLNLIISKSGNTLETICNFNLLLHKQKKNKNVILCEKKNNYLSLLGKKLKAEIFEHKNYIGGRYSVLSETGMLPAELMGLNEKKFKKFNYLIKNKHFINNLIQNNRIPIPDVLKMDVQGFEMNILNGATQCFKHTEIIILETYLYSFLHNQPIFSEIVNFMYDNGYVIFDFEPFNRHKKTKILRYFDTIFIKKDSDIRKLAS